MGVGVPLGLTRCHKRLDFPVRTADKISGRPRGLDGSLEPKAEVFNPLVPRSMTRIKAAPPRAGRRTTEG